MKCSLCAAPDPHARTHARTHARWCLPGAEGNLSFLCLFDFISSSFVLTLLKVLVPPKVEMKIIGIPDQFVWWSSN